MLNFTGYSEMQIKTTVGAQRNGVTLAESGPTLETNDKVQSQWKFFEHRQHKRRRCYIKNLT